MGLDIWFAEDIRNALLAANEASAQTAAVIAEVGYNSACEHVPIQFDSSQFVCQICGRKWSLTRALNLIRANDNGLTVNLRAYREGYKAALTTVALAFGISPQAITGGPPEELAGTVQIPARFAAAREP